MTNETPTQPVAKSVNQTAKRSAVSWLFNARFWLAGPVTLLLSICVMAMLSRMLPEGRAGIDHIVLPVVLFPLLWAAAFFYAVLAERKKTALFVMLGLLLVFLSLVIASVMGML